MATQYEKRQAKQKEALSTKLAVSMEKADEDKAEAKSTGEETKPKVEVTQVAATEPVQVVESSPTPPKATEKITPTEKVPPTETAKKYGAVSSPTQFPKFEQSNLLQLDSGIQEHLTSLGFKWRFIDWGEYCKNTYTHPSQWRPFEFSAEIRGSNRPWALGIDAEGLIGRKDLVLAVRPISMHNEHVAKLAETNRMYRHFEDKKADDFREFAQQRGVKTHVSKGSVTQTRG